MGVSAGGGMIHSVLLTTDEVGRSILDTRVFDVDPTDGLDTADRVNAGIDLMLTAARDAGRRVGPIGVAARPDALRRGFGSRGSGVRGSGPRRQITLVGDADAVVECLSATGEIDRFASVVVLDCGDTGMSMYTVDPRTRSVSHLERSRAISGRELDGLLAARVVAANAGDDAARTRGFRSSLLSACRTAKEELSGAAPSVSVSISGGDGSARASLTAQAVEEAAVELVADARGDVERYVRAALSRVPAPEALVLVGGLANVPSVRTMVDDVAGSVFDGALDVVAPADPELVGAIGAAIAARQTAHGRLAFIGGRRTRGWFSAAPLAVVGAIIAAAMMTFYAVSSSLTGNQAPAPTPTSSSQRSVADTSTTTSTTSTTTVQTTDPVPPSQVPQDGPAFVNTPERVEPRWNDDPGWATTELPNTPPSTTTRTLVPYPVPSLPWPERSPRAPIPTDIIPPDLLPDQGQRTPPPPIPVPRSQQQARPSPVRPSVPTPTPPQPSGQVTTTPVVPPA